MWEYKKEDYSFNLIGEITKKLNEEGQNNWEIIYYNETKPEKFGDDIKINVLFKRLKNEEKKSNYIS